ncbi:hypothetical protein PVAND_006800 [Polypedilum vanderplanki]|uniref:Uncharacterized protein n=1 Tax=Polypedilum vanderplanki TaxID=319348 RepID=A0A9J6C4B2_POLVA|nr:hypothetical protein PVAND_006800 [Polypedilum vanderplanki]
MTFCVCLKYTLLGIVILSYFLRKYAKGQKYTKKTLIENKVVIITGANTGIGKATAIDLAKRGGKVYIACRDEKRGEDALKEIKRESGSDNVHFIQLDLGSTESIREFSQKFHEKEEKLHILINNAGIFAPPQKKTKDGFEITIGVNHLGHFLLTHLLLDLLKNSAPSRIINVSSGAHKMVPIEKDDFMQTARQSNMNAYAKSKLANVMFSQELVKKLKHFSVSVNSLHPGVVHTEITRSWPLWDFILNIIFRPFLRTPVEGAQTQIRLAVDPALENVTGKYFENCKQAKVSKFALDHDIAEWLYKKSYELVKL